MSQVRAHTQHLLAGSFQVVIHVRRCNDTLSSNGGLTCDDTSQVTCYGACVHTTEWDRDLVRETLHEIMKSADLNQSAVGKLAGRHRSTATRWLSGEHQPDYEAAASFATALAQQRPDLGELAQRFLAAAGYASTRASGEASPVEYAISAHNSAQRALEDLRQLAHEQDKTIGDILVERGLASPEELTLSDAKRHDPIVKEILESDLSEETKNSILMAYVEQRRGHFKQAGAE